MMDPMRGNNGPRYKHVVDETAPYETIQVDKLTPIIGAEISGVNLAGPISNQQMDEIHRALAENAAIFFRDQDMSPEQHLAFGRNFGDLHLHPAAPHAPGHEELMIIHADKNSPRANGEGWHSDVSCAPTPPMGSILYIKTCPPKGGDTLFASMYAAYEALSDKMKAYLEGMVALTTELMRHEQRSNCCNRRGGHEDQADARSGERAGVVDAVTDHGHVADRVLAQAGDLRGLVLRQDIGDGDGGVASKVEGRGH